MPSIIEGYNYDIFISYRQKDNKYDGWVTEFVDNLKKELEATFKEEISVYFDINPHDGLLETHDVDASLKDKLKCLIFIPIISRTYCDPKSFAWEYEFKVFIEQASQDQFGLKVKLPNGNVANRVLPVRIYELDFNDIKLCESLIGGVLRGIDFIYKSAGVNRPLRANEDHPHDNLIKTYYRDQINKVANAVKDIIYCLNPESKTQIAQQEQPVIEFQDFKESVPDLSAGHFTNEKPSEPITEKLALGKKWAITLFLITFIFGILGLWGWLRHGSDSFNKITTYSTIPVESILMDGGGQYPYFSISPDGRTIAYSSDKGIQLRSLTDFSMKLLEGTERTTQVAFSPDGQSLVFEKDGHIYKIGITGSPISLVYSKGAGPGLSWGIDEYVYFSPGLGSEGIWRVSVNGGEPKQITYVIDSLGENAHTWPQLLPDSKTLLFTALGPSGGSLDSRIVIQQLNSGKRKVLIDKAIFGLYLFNGNLLFGNNEGNLFTLPFDLRKLKIKGEPTAVLSGVNTATWSGAAFISVSETGNLIFLSRNNGVLNVLDVVDRSGKLIERDSIPTITLERMGHGWFNINISPFGNLLACTGRSFGSIDVWLLNLDTGDPERITFDPSEDEFPVWSPDGNCIAYSSALTGTTRRLYIKDLRSAGNPHLIRTWPRHIHFTSWSPDGKWLAAYDYNSTNGTDCFTISVDSGKFISIAVSQANESGGQFSPDGRWLTYQSDESGRSEIYVVSFPNLDSKRQISIDGGKFPQWDPSGKFIYYLNSDYIIAQPVEISNEFKKGKPVGLFQANASNFDLSPDSQSFYLMRKNNNRPNQPLYLITNWFEVLKTGTSK